MPGQFWPDVSHQTPAVTFSYLLCIVFCCTVLIINNFGRLFVVLDFFCTDFINILNYVDVILSAPILQEVVQSYGALLLSMDDNRLVLNSTVIHIFFIKMPRYNYSWMQTNVYV